MTKAAKELWPLVEGGSEVTRHMLLHGKPDEWRVGFRRTRSSVARQLTKAPGMIMVKSTPMRQVWRYQKPDPA